MASNPDPIKAIQEAYDKATPGEWENDGGSVFVRGMLSWLMGDGVPADCDFAVAAHNHWPAVAATLARLTADLPTARAEAERLRDELKDTLLEAVADLADEKGVYDSCANRGYMAMLDRLVELGVLTRDPGGVGRRWFYRAALAEAAARGGKA